VMTESLTEIQVDSMVGLTHHFGGHAQGNLASHQNQGAGSSPKKAALQGLKKMMWVLEHGGVQMVLPPLRRPHIATLNALGYGGESHELCARVWKENPELLRQVSSSSFIWTANLGYVCPSTDSADGKLHLSVANLNSHFHRQLEAKDRSNQLNIIFERTGAKIHKSLSYKGYEDEGAANHTRCAGEKSGPLHIFVNSGGLGRQSLKAQEAWVRQTGLHDEHVLFLTQHPKAVEAGVFHNDVIATGWRSHYVCHELAYEPESMAELQRVFAKRDDLNLHVIQDQDLSLDEAVQCYFFNSQWFSAQDGSSHGLAPIECLEDRPNHIMEKMSSSLGLHLTTLNLNESMMNGGGPACLRWRIPVIQKELSSLHSGVMLTPELGKGLNKWIEKYHDDVCVWESLSTPGWWQKEQDAFSELSSLLHWPEAL
jgi:succinylarginine dihydrolase